MTSKEALEIITDSIIEDCRPCSCSDCIENSGPCLEYRAIKRIEKDLEFLETIKKYCDIELFYEFAFNRYLLSFTEKDKTKDTFDTPISREDAEKIMKYFDYLNEDKEVRT